MEEPYLRQATEQSVEARLVPEGWVSEPAGRWRGRYVEVVYDPRRHDITFVRGRIPAKVIVGMRTRGFQLRGVDGPTQWWIRDRLRAAGDRSQCEAAESSGISLV